MAARVDGVLREDLRNAIIRSKVLVVGAGGIGCEVLKNLVMSGFVDIEIIDLDTIDISNLNRQFLFQKKHVGKSKADVARETALLFNPDAKIVHYHDSIVSPDFGLSFFKKFSLVMNALDNRAARNHVNRMCLAANVPLVESGTAGYEGQVELIRKGLTQCYECNPKAAQRSFPGCTIRNTPSEPVHCVVWAKHLFNQLFGEEDPDQDVSPDTADPEAAGSAGEGALRNEADWRGNVDRVSTRAWAQSCAYDPEKLFAKLFNDDIKYLLSMDNLWKRRRPPAPLEWGRLPDGVPGCSRDTGNSGLKDQQRWSIAKCGAVFAEATKNLSKALALSRKKSADNHLIWDKDDANAMDFVAACANIRAYIFGIPQKTRFDIKSIAGNIIPAIATTNAIIAGIVLLHAFRILKGDFESCRSVYLRQKVNHRNQLLVPEKYVNPPNTKCYVCAPTPQAILALDPSKMTIGELDNLVLKDKLNMIAPDVVIDGTGVLVISSEVGETEENNSKVLEELGIRDGTILKVDDFQQNYSVTVTVVYREKPSAKDGNPDFLILADEESLKPKERSSSVVSPSASNGQVAKVHDDLVEVVEAAPLPSHSDTVKKRKTVSPEKDTVHKRLKIDVTNRNDDNDDDDDDDDDDVCVVDDNGHASVHPRSHTTCDISKSTPNKQKLTNNDEDCFIVDDGNDCATTCSLAKRK